jgi:hypothetical protein
MGATLHYFMLPDDERSLFRLLARRGVTVYPELIPPGYTPLAAGEDAPERLDGAAYYLAVERLGPVVVHPVKRGPDKGMLVVEEIPSPVFHYERCLRNAEGELVAGRLWAELEITDDPGSRLGKPHALKVLFLEIQDLFKKSWRRSDPRGFWIGPHAATALKREGLRLREPGFKGRLIGVWR